MGKVKWNTESFKKFVADVNNGEFELAGLYEGYKVKTEIVHVECGRKFLTDPSHFINRQRCSLCSVENGHEKQKFYTEDIIGLINNVNPSKFKYSSGDYVDMRSTVEIYCMDCNEVFSIRVGNFLQRKRCNSCFERETRLKTQDDFVNEIETIYGKLYTVIGKYTGATEKLEILCNKCNKSWYPIPTNLLRGYQCPSCNMSKGERRIQSYLENQNIDFIPQYRFNDCRDKNPLPFDFYLPKYNIVIEYQGGQHYYPVEQFGGIEAFAIQQKRDNIKRKYCWDSGINLIEIPYTRFEEVEKIIEKEVGLSE